MPSVYETVYERALLALAKSRGLTLGDMLVAVRQPEMFAQAAQPQRRPQNHYGDSGVRHDPDAPHRDGSVKGQGFLGQLAMPDGGVMSEYSGANTLGAMRGGAWQQGVPMVSYPQLVPTLTEDEVLALQRNTTSGEPVPDALRQSIARKAEAHALQRNMMGRDMFAGEGEQDNWRLPNVRRIGTVKPSDWK